MLQALFQRPVSTIQDVFSVEHITIQYILHRPKFLITSRTSWSNGKLGTRSRIVSYDGSVIDVGFGLVGPNMSRL